MVYPFGNDYENRQVARLDPQATRAPHEPARRLVRAAPVPDVQTLDPAERARHLKAAGYYFDASMMGVCELPPAALLAQPIRNPIVGEPGTAHRHPRWTDHPQAG